MRTGMICVLLLAAVGCGANLGPAKTPRETLSRFEKAMKTLDAGALYDLLSSRTRAQIDQAMNQLKSLAAVLPSEALDEIGLGDLADMEPREILVAAISRAKKDNPEALEALKGITIVVLDEKVYGETASLKVSMLANGQEQTDRIEMVRENGRWYLDSDEQLDQLPINLASQLQACAPGPGGG